MKIFGYIALAVTLSLNGSIFLTVFAQSKADSSKGASFVVAQNEDSGPAGDASKWVEQLKQKVVPENTPAAPAGNGLINRITVLPPRLDHAAVSPRLISAVREAVKRLPPSVYDLLDKNGTTITLAPNIIDKWPDAGDVPKPFTRDETLGEETGRTYGHDIYLYEREKIRGSNDLKAAHNPEFVVQILYEVMGHAVDDAKGLPSDNKEFQAQLAIDIDNLSSAERESLSYFCVPMECYSECAGSLMGGRKSIVKYFPHSKAWVKTNLGL